MTFLRLQCFVSIFSRHDAIVFNNAVFPFGNLEQPDQFKIKCLVVLKCLKIMRHTFIKRFHRYFGLKANDVFQDAACTFDDFNIKTLCVCLEKNDGMLREIIDIRNHVIYPSDLHGFRMMDYFFLQGR